MLWSLVFCPSLTLAFSWASLFSGSGVAADQYVVQAPPEPTTPRVAIVGAGAAGSSAAFWISKAANRQGKEIIIDIYEVTDRIGGRTAVVYPYNDTTLHPVEVGASIFVDANKHLVRATKEFELETLQFDDDEATVGVWDGNNFLVTIGANSFFGKIWENIRMLWRYGYRSPVTTSTLVKQMIDRYLALYSTVTHWDSVEGVSAALNFTDLVSQTAASFLASQGVGDAYAYEIVEASSRVNYGQNLDDIHGFGGMVSMATGGAKGVRKGNYNIFENFVKKSNANVHFKKSVTSISETEDSKWTITTVDVDSDKSEVSKPYDRVIVAAPIRATDELLPKSVAPPSQVDYVHLHVTLLSTTSPSAKATYFNLDPSEVVPSMVLTTAQGIRAGGPAPEFNSLSYHGRVAEGKDEWVVKIFSEARIEDEWLATVFDNVGWVHRKEWDAYPKLVPTTKYNPMKLAGGLYYVNGFEAFISTMETETLASRGVVDFMFRDWFGEGLCPTDVSEPPPEGVDFLWGWDC